MSDHLWKPGQSGNPAGRKPGSKNRKTLILEELEKDGSALAAAIKAKALGGDPAAMSLWLTRIEPPARTRGETVELEFDASKPLADQMQAIVTAVADGELTLEQGKQFVEIVEKLALVRAKESGSDDSALINALKVFAQNVPA